MTSPTFDSSRHTYQVVQIHCVGTILELVLSPLKGVNRDEIYRTICSKGTCDSFLLTFEVGTLREPEMGTQRQRKESTNIRHYLVLVLISTKVTQDTQKDLLKT